MKIHSVGIVAAVASLLTSALPASAWGPEGHRIVAHIAELRLTDEAHQALAQLLAPTEQISDNTICNWPDYIRQEQQGTGPWHYVDIPQNADAYEPSRDCPNGQCVIEQIEAMEKIVEDETKSVEDRNIALRYLVHFLGDLHQPLHCIDYDADRGGNDRPVVYPGQSKPTNLHAVWDMNLVYSMAKPLGALEYADKLNSKISNRRAKQWAKGTPEEWAWESHELALHQAYAVVPPKEGPPVALDAAYVKASKKVVQLQLMKAGIRLAEVLNRSLPALSPANDG